jgi:hypothetical protein
MAKITEQPATMVWVQAYCDVCSGTLVSAGMAQMTAPPKYKHVCEDCGAVEWLAETFPHSRVRRLNRAPRLAGTC